MSDPKPSNALTRRDAAKLAVGAAATVALTGVAYQMRKARLGEPMTQDDANRIYKDLYDKIEAEHKIAQREGKKLAVLCAEQHTTLNAMMIELMVVDIMRRLKLSPHSVEEVNASDKAIIEKANTDTLKGFDEILKAAPNYSELSKDPTTMRIIGTRFLISYLNQVEPRPIDPDTGSKFGFLETPMLVNQHLGVPVHAADPLNRERIKAIVEKKGSDAVIDDKFEQPMADVAIAVGKDHHIVGCFGSAHVPALCQKLSAEGMHAVGINCSVGVRPMFTGPLFAERLALVDKMYTPNLKNKRDAANDGEAMAKVVLASINDRQERGEMSRQDAIKETAIYADLLPGGKTR